MRYIMDRAMMWFAVATVLAPASAAHAKGCVEWSGIEPHPAVVNPVCDYEPGTVVDLCGEWSFAAVKLHPDRAKMPYKAEWPGERKIMVPGAWQWQGVGKPCPLPLRCCYGGHSRGKFPLNAAGSDPIGGVGSGGVVELCLTFPLFHHSTLPLATQRAGRPLSQSHTACR